MLLFWGQSKHILAAEGVWLGSRRRFESAAFHIYSGLRDSRFAHIDGLQELRSGLASLHNFSADEGLGGLALLLASVFG